MKQLFEMKPLHWSVGILLAGVVVARATTIQISDPKENEIKPSDQVQHCVVIPAGGTFKVKLPDQAMLEVNGTKEAEKLARPLIDALLARHIEARVDQEANLATVLANPGIDTVITIRTNYVGTELGDPQRAQLVSVLRLPEQRKAGKLVMRTSWEKGDEADLVQPAALLVETLLDGDGRLSANLLQSASHPIAVETLTGEWSGERGMKLVLNSDGTFTDTFPYYGRKTNGGVSPYEYVLRDSVNLLYAPNPNQKMALVVSSGKWVVQDQKITLSDIVSTDKKRAKTESYYLDWMPAPDYNRIVIRLKRDTLPLMNLKRATP